MTCQHNQILSHWSGLIRCAECGQDLEIPSWIRTMMANEIQGLMANEQGRHAQILSLLQEKQDLQAENQSLRASIENLTAPVEPAELKTNVDVKFYVDLVKPTNQEEANRILSETVENIERLLKHAETVATDYDLSFHIEPAYGMGGWFQSGEWTASSQSC